MSVKRMYVLVRRDLSPSQQSVQGMHAVASFMLDHGSDEAVRDWARNDRYLIALGVDGEGDLREWEATLSKEGIPSATFLEPDIGNQRTAMAIHPSADRKLFKGLRLL